jgi:nucleoside-diphosphate-sugar epimerase
MRAIIIGGSSSLGMALIPILSEFCEVITAGRNNCDIKLNLHDPIEKIIFPNDVDVVIHTAAHFGGNTAEDILEAESINVLGTLKLCQASVNANVKQFILISSIFSCINEDSEFYNIYTLSKKHSEEAAQLFCQIYSLPLAILKPSQMYGNDDGFKKHQPFFYFMIDRAERGEDITIYGSNDALRNFIHVNDLAVIVAKVIQGKIEGTYPCMAMNDLTYSQIAGAALSAFNSGGKVRFQKDKPNIPDNIFEKNDSLYKKISFYPQITIEDGMKKIARYRKNKN